MDTQFGTASAARAFQERMGAVADAVSDAHYNMAVEEFNERQEALTGAMDLGSTIPKSAVSSISGADGTTFARTFYERDLRATANESEGGDSLDVATVGSVRALKTLGEIRDRIRNSATAVASTDAVEMAIVQDQESLWQNVWSYAAIAIVLSAFTLVVARRSYFQLLLSFDILFFFLSHIRAHITVLTQRNAASIKGRVYVARALLNTGNSVLGLMASLLIFAFVTLLMGRITPVVRESALAITAVARMATIPALFMGTPPKKALCLPCD